MGFKAEEATSKLEWDFRPYLDAHGVSPEPSGTALWVFQQNWTNISNAARRTAVSRAAMLDQQDKEKSKDEIAAELADWAAMDWEQAVKATGDLMSGLYGEVNLDELHGRLAAQADSVTGGCPSQEQIMGLPGRVRAAYLGWFAGELTDPEG
jgi:hypothetical protein